jgi:hypothetical protein
MPQSCVSSQHQPTCPNSLHGSHSALCLEESNRCLLSIWGMYVGRQCQRSRVTSTKSILAEAVPTVSPCKTIPQATVGLGGSPLLALPQVPLFLFLFFNLFIFYSYVHTMFGSFLLPPHKSLWIGKGEGQNEHSEPQVPSGSTPSQCPWVRRGITSFRKQNWVCGSSSTENSGWGLTQDSSHEKQ